MLDGVMLKRRKEGGRPQVWWSQLAFQSPALLRHPDEPGAEGPAVTLFLPHQKPGRAVGEGFSGHPAMICLPQKSLDGKLLLFNLSDFWDRSLFP